MSIDCRLILDEPGDGAWNMAVDEALMESAAGGGPATLRLYQWAEPTLSLGYFQAYADRSTHTPSESLACVRRSSGGGAIVHHHEVTYSLALPAEALREVADTRSLYCNAHRAVCEAVQGLGGEAERLSLCDPEGSPSEEPFLCFLRRADGDLLCSPADDAPLSGVMNETRPGSRYKVGGSAQRKRHGALLQHGSVLLSQSPHAPELPGLADLGVLTTDPQALQASLAQTLTVRLGLAANAGRLESTEEARARELVQTKHAAAEWIQRR